MPRTGGRSVRAVICACFYVIGAIRLVWCLPPGDGYSADPREGRQCLAIPQRRRPRAEKGYRALNGPVVRTGAKRVVISMAPGLYSAMTCREDVVSAVYTPIGAGDECTTSRDNPRPD
jgi:hypothetical protein